MRTINKLIGLTALAVAIQGCGGDNGPTLQAAPTEISSKALFDPTSGADFIPFPIDLLFSGSADGSVNVPDQPNSVPAGTDPDKFNPAFIALNTMDGFSTTAPMVVRFSGAVDDPTDPDDLKNGIRVFEADQFDPGAQGPITINRPLVWGVDYVAGVSGGVSVLIQPLRPLASGKTHIVVVTDSLKTRSGEPVTADDTYSLLNGSVAFSLVGNPDTPGTPIEVEEYVTLGDGETPCDFSNPPASLATCTTKNPVYEGSPSPLGDIYQSLTLSQLIALEPLRSITYKHLVALAGQGLTITDVKLSYGLSTQNVESSALAAAKGVVDTTDPTFTVFNPVAAWAGSEMLRVVSPGDDGEVNAANDHHAHIYLATLNDVVQFLDPNDQNGSQWRGAGNTNLGYFNGFLPAVVVADHDIPVLVSAPRIEKLDPLLDPDDDFADCTGPLPLVIYQHGITTSRASLLAIADTLAKACVVGVAIDLPKHGILPENDPFGASQLSQLYQGLQALNMIDPPTLERLVQVSSPMTECSDGAGTLIEPDGDFYCNSGDNFINLPDLANSRDGLRQAVTDLHSLYRALEQNGGALGAAIGAGVDTGEIHFVGMSLGGIVGAVFAANEPGLTTVTLNVSGGGIAKILDGSPSFEPRITAGLYSAGGLIKPSGSYEGFLIMAQTLIDNTDPINFATALTDTNTPVMMQEVIGDPSAPFGTCILDGEGCPDQVVPNNTFGSSFGPAWGLVAQTGQSSFLANQNFVTTPVALSGSDPLAQGTGFVVGASVAASNTALAPTVVQVGPLGMDNIIAAVNGAAPGTFPPGTTTFKGLQLRTVTSCGATGSGVVRYTTGSHSSLLSPEGEQGETQYLEVTQTMQSQIAGFIRSAGNVIAADENGVVFDPVVDSPVSQAPCAPAT